MRQAMCLSALPIWLWVLSMLGLTCAQAADHPLANSNDPVLAEKSAEPSLFSLALVGDVPYGEREMPAMERLITHINQDPEVELVLHAGDIKSGGTECSDQRLQERFEQIQRWQKPVLYTPGDNEWTDCHRRRAGAYAPLERLAFLRQLFFVKPNQAQPYTTLGQPPLPVISQAQTPAFAEFVENQRLILHNLLIMSIHVVGSENGLEPWGSMAGDSRKQPAPQRLKAFEQRQTAALAWLRAGFAKAKAQHLDGVLILIHANPRFELAPGHPKRQGFSALIQGLKKEVMEYSRPVLLAHGDFHTFVQDKPLVNANGKPLGHFTRVQSFGSPSLYWVKITLNSQWPFLFSVEQKFVPGN